MRQQVVVLPQEFLEKILENLKERNYDTGAELMLTTETELSKGNLKIFNNNHKYSDQKTSQDVSSTLFCSY